MIVRLFEVLLGILACLWKAMSVFKSIKTFNLLVNNVVLHSCPLQCNESEHYLVKWAAQVITSRTTHMIKIPLNTFALHDAFALVD